MIAVAQSLNLVVFAWFNPTFEIVEPVVASSTVRNSLRSDETTPLREEVTMLNEVALPEVEYGEGDSIIADLLPSKLFPSHVFWILGLWLSSYQRSFN